MTPLVRVNAGHDFGGLIKHVMGCSDLDGHAAMDGEGAVKPNAPGAVVHAFLGQMDQNCRGRRLRPFLFCNGMR